MVLGIFKTVLRLRDRHVFMGQSLKVSNVFNTLTLEQIFWKTNTFFKKLEYRFLAETTMTEKNIISIQNCCQKPMLREREWRIQNALITKSGILSVFSFLENLFQF